MVLGRSTQTAAGWCVSATALTRQWKIPPLFRVGIYFRERIWGSNAVPPPTPQEERSSYEYILGLDWIIYYFGLSCFFYLVPGTHENELDYSGCSTHLKVCFLFTQPPLCGSGRALPCKNRLLKVWFLDQQHLRTYSLCRISGPIPGPLNQNLQF